MTAVTSYQTHDSLGVNEPEQRATTSHEVSQKVKKSFLSRDDATDCAEPELTVSDSHFEPNKIYYIQGHHMSSKTITIVDITGQVPIAFVDGKNVDEKFREAAQQAGTAKTAHPAFVFKKNHWYNKSYKAYAGADESVELAKWKHPAFSTGTATLDFPAGSTYSPHDLAVKPVSWKRRTNEFVIESVPFTWHFGDKYKSHRMTLSKRIGGVDSTIARYSQKWSAW